MKKKKILLIIPTVTVNEKERIRVPRLIYNPTSTLPSVGACTPKEFDVETIEEEIEDVDYDRECDLVGISSMTAQASRAYDIAKEFKKRGKTVVFGGHHPSALPGEALQYGDSVVIGEAEGGAWENLLADYLKGKLKPTYRSGGLVDLATVPPVRRDLYKDSATFIKFDPLLFTRGCPYTCDFCSIPQLYGKKIRNFPISRVIEDIKASRKKTFFFYDDNILCLPNKAKELFRAIAPLKIKWGSQASISYLKDQELLDLAAESGCMFLLFGLETVSKSNLKVWNKNFSDLQKLEDNIKRVQDKGIITHTALVFGFDHDTEAVFDETLEFLLKNKIGSALFNLLTPYPGTKVYEQFKEQGRLLTDHWRRYDTHTVVFKPKNMTPQQLVDGYLKVRQGFYNLNSIGKRFLARKANWSHPLAYMAINLYALSVTWKHVTAVPERTNIVLNGRDDKECQYKDELDNEAIEKEPAIA